MLVDDRNVFGTDVVWYRDGRVPGLHAPRPYAMPDLVAEVRSTSTRFDIGAKKAAYERHGARRAVARGKHDRVEDDRAVLRRLSELRF